MPWLDKTENNATTLTIVKMQNKIKNKNKIITKNNKKRSKKNMKKLILALTIFACTLAPATTHAWTEENTLASLKVGATGAALISSIIFAVHSYRQHSKYKNQKNHIVALLKKYKNIQAKKTNNELSRSAAFVEQELLTEITTVLETITNKKIELAKAKDFLEQKEKLWGASTIASTAISIISGALCVWAATTLRNETPPFDPLDTTPIREGYGAPLETNGNNNLTNVTLADQMREKFNTAFEAQFPNGNREHKEAYKKRINEKFIPRMIRNDAWQSVDNLPLDNLFLSYEQENNREQE